MQFLAELLVATRRSDSAEEVDDSAAIRSGNLPHTNLDTRAEKAVPDVFLYVGVVTRRLHSQSPNKLIALTNH